MLVRPSALPLSLRERRISLKQPQPRRAATHRHSESSSSTLSFSAMSLAVDTASNPFDDPLTMSILVLSLLRAQARVAVLSLASRGVRERAMFSDSPELGATIGAELRKRTYGLDCTDDELIRGELLDSFDESGLDNWARYRRLDAHTLHSAVEFARTSDNVGLVVLVWEPEERRGWVFEDLLVCSAESWDAACDNLPADKSCEPKDCWFDSEAEAEDAFIAALEKTTLDSENAAETPELNEEQAYWDAYLPPEEDEARASSAPKSETPAKEGDDEDSYWDSYGF